MAGGRPPTPAARGRGTLSPTRRARAGTSDRADGHRDGHRLVIPTRSDDSESGHRGTGVTVTSRRWHVARGRAERAGPARPGLTRGRAAGQPEAPDSVTSLSSPGRLGPRRPGPARPGRHQSDDPMITARLPVTGESESRTGLP